MRASVIGKKPIGREEGIFLIHEDSPLYRDYRLFRRVCDDCPAGIGKMLNQGAIVKRETFHDIRRKGNRL